MMRFNDLAVAIDRSTTLIGGLLRWLVLAMVLISAGNALTRYSLGLSSNAWLEVQWFLFSAVFLLGAGYALQQDQHVRIDVVSSRLGPAGRAYIDLLGTLFFLLPICVLMVWLSWPVFTRGWTSGEISSNAGGLPLWPARLMVPVGFTLLGLQGIAEMIKAWTRIRRLEAPKDVTESAREDCSA